MLYFLVRFISCIWNGDSVKQALVQKEYFITIGLMFFFSASYSLLNRLFYNMSKKGIRNIKDGVILAVELIVAVGTIFVGIGTERDEFTCDRWICLLIYGLIFVGYFGFVLISNFKRYGSATKPKILKKSNIELIYAMCSESAPKDWLNEYKRINKCNEEKNKELVSEKEYIQKLEKKFDFVTKRKQTIIIIATVVIVITIIQCIDENIKYVVAMFMRLACNGLVAYVIFRCYISKLKTKCATFKRMKKIMFEKNITFEQYVKGDYTK